MSPLLLSSRPNRTDVKAEIIVRGLVKITLQLAKK